MKPGAWTWIQTDPRRTHDIISPLSKQDSFPMIIRLSLYMDREHLIDIDTLINYLINSFLVNHELW